jgi:hypothetical protein
MDPDGWTTASVYCWLGDKDSITSWGEIELTTGITSKNRAWRAGMRALRRSQAEKVAYSFTTEMDALNSTYLDYADICDDLPNFTQFGRMVDYQKVVNDDGDTIAKITVDRDLTWTDDATHYMTVRRHVGTGNGPFVATQISDRVVQLDNILDFTPNLTGKIEPPLWLFGDADTYREETIIKSIKPSVSGDTTTCKVTASNYDSSIFDDDDNDAPEDYITWWGDTTDNPNLWSYDDPITVGNVDQYEVIAGDYDGEILATGSAYQLIFTVSGTANSRSAIRFYMGGEYVDVSGEDAADTYTLSVTSAGATSAYIVERAESNASSDLVISDISVKKL